MKITTRSLSLVLLLLLGLAGRGRADAPSGGCPIIAGQVVLDGGVLPSIYTTSMV